MRRYATLRRSATLKHKVLSGDASWKYFRFERRIASQRRRASHISKKYTKIKINRIIRVIK